MVRKLYIIRSYIVHPKVSLIAENNQTAPQIFRHHIHIIHYLILIHELIHENVISSLYTTNERNKLSKFQTLQSCDDRQTDFFAWNSFKYFQYFFSSVFHVNVLLLLYIGMRIVSSISFVYSWYN